MSAWEENNTTNVKISTGSIPWTILLVKQHYWRISEFSDYPAGIESNNCAWILSCLLSNTNACPSPVVTNQNRVFFSIRLVFRGKAGSAISEYSLRFFSPLFILVSDRPVVQFPTDHPQNLTLAEGETATFYCKTIGNPATTAHKWQFNGNDLQGEACDDCPSTTLRIGSVRRQDEGLYGCVGTNSMGNGPPAKAQLLIKRE